MITTFKQEKEIMRSETKWCPVVGALYVKTLKNGIEVDTCVVSIHSFDFHTNLREYILKHNFELVYMESSVLI